MKNKNVVALMVVMTALSIVGCSNSESDRKGKENSDATIKVEDEKSIESGHIAKVENTEEKEKVTLLTDIQNNYNFMVDDYNEVTGLINAGTYTPSDKVNKTIEIAIGLIDKYKGDIKEEMFSDMADMKDVNSQLCETIDIFDNIIEEIEYSGEEFEGDEESFDFDTIKSEYTLNYAGQDPDGYAVYFSANEDKTSGIIAIISMDKSESTVYNGLMVKNDEGVEGDYIITDLDSDDSIDINIKENKEDSDSIILTSDENEETVMYQTDVDILIESLKSI